MPLVLELPPLEEQHAANLRRWAELETDLGLASTPDRVETDRFGNVMMSPFAGGWHGRLEFKIGLLLEKRLGEEVIMECPISTSDGVRLADVGWYSPPRFSSVKQFSAYPEAPEICVEVVSPSNSMAEMHYKRRLYFEAGAIEFWLCSREGKLTFYDTPEGESVESSGLCQDFPHSIEV
ncbi:MAG: Uma2 family endonuclease [Verrucomicrobiota bacterium]